MLKNVVALQADFLKMDLDRNGIRDYWAGDLAGLVFYFDSGAPQPTWFRKDTLGLLAELAKADPSRSDANPYRGYWLVPLEADADGIPYRNTGRNRIAFGFCAYPMIEGETGRSTFIVNESRTVLVGDGKGPPPRKWPTEPELKQKWGRFQ